MILERNCQLWWKNIKISRLLKKYNIKKKEILDQLIEELKQKVSAKTQRLSRYRKRQNQYHQNKLFKMDCKKFYNCLRQTYSCVKMHQTKRKWKTSPDICPPIPTLRVRPKRNSFTHVTTLQPTPEFAIFISSRSCGTKSKAFEKSTSITSILSPLTKEPAMF